MNDSWYSHLRLTECEERSILVATKNTMNRLGTVSKPTGEDARVISLEEVRKVPCKSIGKKRAAIFFHVCAELGIDCHRIGPQFRTEG